MDIRRPGVGACCAGVLLSLVFLTAAAVLAPPAAGSPAAFWSQPPRNDGSKISSEVIADPFTYSEVAGDFVAETDGWVGTVAWWGGPYRTNESNVTVFGVSLYADVDCSPGAFPLETAFSTEVTSTPAGTDGRGFDIFKYEAPVSFAVAAGARYWISIQAYVESFPPQWGRLQATEVRDCPGVFRSPYFGYNTWVDASQVAGSPWDASVEVTMGVGALGACCIPVYGFCALGLERDCETNGGVYQGDGTVCDPNPCPVEELQACCLPFGIGCTMLSVELCQQATGTPQGEGTTCDPDPCGGATEACCFTGGTCSMLSAELCTQAGGTPQGEAVTCDTFPCGQPPAEACCFTDGHCEVLVPNACDEAGGSPQTGVLVCTPNPCPVPQLKPCCFADKACEMLYEDDCYIQNGAPSTDGDSCVNIVCPLVIPTRTTTWGQVKALFR